MSFHDSVEALETALEGIDVENGVYKAFDAEGRKLTLKAIGVIRGTIVSSVGIVKLAAAELVPSHQIELSELLRAYLMAVGYSASEDLGLDRLVSSSRQAAAEF